MFGAGAVDVATLFYSEFKSVISQTPSAQQLIPASIPEGSDRGVDLLQGRSSSLIVVVVSSSSSSNVT